MKSKVNFILVLLLIVSAAFNAIFIFNIIEDSGYYEEIEITDVYFEEGTSDGFLVHVGSSYSSEIIKMFTTLTKEEAFSLSGYTAYQANAVIYENEWCVPYQDYDKMTNLGYRFGEIDGIVGWYN